MLKITNSLLFLLAVLITCNQANCQNYYTKNLTTTDGLPSNIIQDIFKDSRGYFWIGTDAGLCKFDGLNFSNYTTKDGLPGNNIWSITEDDIGNIWVACYGQGISKFNGKSFINYSTTDGLVNNNVRKIEYSTKHHGLMIGTVFGFSFLTDNHFISFVDSSVTNRNLIQVTSFLETDSLIYLFTYYDTKQYIVFNPYRQTFHYLDKAHHFHIKSVNSTCSFVTSNGDTIIGDRLDGIKIFSKDTVIINDKVGQVFDIAEDEQGNLWLASYNDDLDYNRHNPGGLYKFSGYKEEYYNSKLHIKNQEVWCLFYDNDENVLWIGTKGNGAYLFPKSGITYKKASEFNVSNPKIHDLLFAKNGTQWITVGDFIFTTDSRRNIIKPEAFQSAYLKYVNERLIYINDKDASYTKYDALIKSGRYKYPNPFRDNLSTFRNLYDPDAFRKLKSQKLRNFNTLSEDKEGNLWVGSNIAKFIVNRNSNKISVFDIIVIPADVLFESQDTIAVIFFFDLLRYNVSEYEIFEEVQLRKNATYSSNCKYLEAYSQNWIYNNTEGIVRYCNGRVITFPYLSDEIDVTFNTMCVDKTGKMIAGTNSGKIIIMSYENDSIKVRHQITDKEGIIATKINWILTDAKNRIWIGTDRGLQAFDLDLFYRTGNIAYKFFNEENGFFDYTTKKALIDSKGDIYVISDDNLIQFNPDRLFEQKGRKHKLVIDKIEVNFTDIYWKEYGAIESWSGLPVGPVVMQHDQSTLTFNYHLLQYSEPSKTLYSYKLEGLQTEWAPFSTETKTIFTNLSPGRYCFNVRAKLTSNPDEISSVEFSFRILPPWYKTWWFFSFMTIVCMVIFYAFFRYRVKKASRKIEIQKRISELEMKAMKAQMNPHFTFNAFNSIQYYILQKDTKSAISYLNDFARLIRKTLENSNAKTISLEEEIEYLKTYMALENRRNDNFDYSIEVDDDIEIEGVFIPPMLIQPLVENAILHGIRHQDKRGKVTVKFELNQSILKCTIEDNGIGRAKSKELYDSQPRTYKSISSNIIKQRTELLNIQMKYLDLCVNGIPSGTKVELLINLN